MTVADFLARFDRKTMTGGQSLVRCPAHADDKASLAVREGEDGRVVLYCHAGCEPERIVSAMGLTLADLFAHKSNGRGSTLGTITHEYDYRDAAGVRLFQAVRYMPKNFRQRRPDGNGAWIWDLKGVPLVLYRLPELKNKEGVAICAGEKDADALVSLGIPATTNPLGEGKWRETYTAQLVAAGVKRVRIFPDNDDPGRTHADQVARSCLAAGLDVKVIALPGVPLKGDVSDFLASHSKMDVLELVKGAPAYKLPPAPVVSPVSEPTQALGAATPIDLASMLDDVTATIRRYVVLSAPQSHAVALWVVHTHAFSAAVSEATPYLSITSAVKQSGKTRLLEVLELVAARPWMTGRISPAALYRKIDAEMPTLLLDESDATFKFESEYSEALRGILNTGYRATGRVSVCVGQGTKIVQKDFGTFCPKAIAGIGKLPDTVADRAIPIRLGRRTATEQIDRFRLRVVRPLLAPLRRQLEAWATSALAGLECAALPATPDELGDRTADVWEPLLTIAEAAGGEWPARARDAALVLHGGDSASDNESVDERLLADIFDILENDPVAQLRGLVSSSALVEKLNQVDDAPWREWGKTGKGLTTMALAGRLKPFGLRVASAGTFRGYPLDGLEAVFARYLPSKVSRRQTPNETGPELAISRCQTSDGVDALKGVIPSMFTESSDALTPWNPNTSMGTNGDGAPLAQAVPVPPAAPTPDLSVPVVLREARERVRF